VVISVCYRLLAFGVWRLVFSGRAKLFSSNTLPLQLSKAPIKAEFLMHGKRDHALVM
jgi:hypothetical protein